MELILALKKFATEVLQYWKQLLAIIIIAILMYGSYQLGGESKAKLYEDQIKQMQEADLKAHDQFQKEKIHIAEQYELWRTKHPIIKEVKVYVNTNSDSNCIINDGFLRVHNAAATGQQIGGPRESDDTSTTTKLSEVATIVSGNYEICLNESKKLESLQAIVKAYQESQK